jgi:hypothetical protein
MISFPDLYFNSEKNKIQASEYLTDSYQLTLIRWYHEHQGQYKIRAM